MGTCFLSPFPYSARLATCGVKQDWWIRAEETDGTEQLPVAFPGRKSLCNDAASPLRLLAFFKHLRWIGKQATEV